MARVRTGVRELDEMLRGGFMEGDAVMLAGSAGTGKTTLALQYLVNGITQFGQRGIYVTFEQMPYQMYRDARSLGWDLEKLEEENKFRLVCTSPNLLLENDGGGEGLLTEAIKEVQPQRLVIDSLSHLSMFIEEKELRKEMYRLIMLLKARGLSSVLVWEMHQMTGQAFSISEVGSSFLVDAIILLTHVEIESSMRKALVIVKMRGSDHDKQLREFEITPQGIKIEAPFSEYEGVMTGSPRRIAQERFVEVFKQAAQKHK
jgi:circadian clock protein KaiC